MLQLAGDLGFLDEAADHLGLFAVRFEQDLDGEVAAEVRIATLEHGSHAAAGDLAEELQPRRAFGGSGISVDDGRITGPGSEIESASAEQDRRDLAERFAEPAKTLGEAGPKVIVTSGIFGTVAEQSRLQQASRAEPWGASEGRLWPQPRQQYCRPSPDLREGTHSATFS